MRVLFAAAGSLFDNIQYVLSAILVEGNGTNDEKHEEVSGFLMPVCAPENQWMEG